MYSDSFSSRRSVGRSARGNFVAVRPARHKKAQIDVYPKENKGEGRKYPTKRPLLLYHAMHLSPVLFAPIKLLARSSVIRASVCVYSGV